MFLPLSGCLSARQILTKVFGGVGVFWGIVGFILLAIRITIGMWCSRIWITKFGSGNFLKDSLFTIALPVDRIKCENPRRRFELSESFLVTELQPSVVSDTAQVYRNSNLLLLTKKHKHFYTTCLNIFFRAATNLENLEKPGNLTVVKEKSGKVEKSGKCFACDVCTAIAMVTE